jgi:amino acid transporter
LNVTLSAPAPAKAFTRSMRVTGVLFLTLSAVTPASSVFVIIPGIIQQSGTGAFIAMAAAALVALAMAFVYAELASAYPLAGGEYAMLGRALDPFVGFVFMGMNVIGSTLPPAILALGASAYLTDIWPGAQSVPIAVLIVAATTVFGILNIRLNAWVTGAFLLVEVVALVVLTVLGFSHIHRGIVALATHPVVLSAGALKAAPVGAIGLATAASIFSYNGFGAAVYFGEEMHDAPQRIGRTILWALALTVLFEFVPMTAVLLGAPNLAALLGSQSPFSDFVRASGGKWVGVAVGLGVALSIVNAVIAVMLINGRFLYSSGRDQVWHRALNGALVRVHGRFDSPWVATLVAGVTGVAACFIPFNVLLVLTGASVVVMYVLLCVAVMVGRLTGRTAHAPYRMPLYPLAPCIGLLALIYVLYANWLDPTVGRPSLIATLVMLVAAALYFFLMRRRRGADWGMVGPVEEPGPG